MGVVGPFAPSQTIFALILSAFSLRDHLLERARREHVAVEQQELLVRDLLRAAQPCKRARLLLVRDRRLDVDAVRVVDAARRVGDGDHRRAFLGEELREEAPDVAEALHGDPRSAIGDVLLADRLADAVERAPRGRLEPAQRAADVERLAGDDAEHRVALVHRVRVEDPGHHGPVGADVGRRDVLLRPDLVDDLRRIAAGQLLELVARELLGVTRDPALRAAERDVHQRALPRHPHGERLDLVERDVGVVPDPALRRPARDVVRHPVSLKRLDRAVVHDDRDRDDDGLLAFPQNLDQVLVDLEDLADLAKLVLGELERVLAEMGDGRLDDGHSVAPCFRCKGEKTALRRV